MAERFAKLVKVQIGISVGAAALTIVLALEIPQLLETRQRLIETSQDLERDIQLLEGNRTALLSNLGWSSKRAAARGLPPEAIRRTIEANSARRKEASRSSAVARSQVTVDVFSRDLDRDVVAESLRELGFAVDLKPPNPRIPEGVATDAIWLGEDISTSDVKLVAYTLIRAGVTIKTIRPFGRPPFRKRNRIEVGSDMEFLNSPPLG